VPPGLALSSLALALVAAAATAGRPPARRPASGPAGLECVVFEWAVPPGTWTCSGVCQSDPSGLLMTASTRDDTVFTTPALAPDDAYLCVGDPWIFGDGFESGDTSAWSATVP